RLTVGSWPAAGTGASRPAASRSILVDEEPGKPAGSAGVSPASSWVASGRAGQTARGMLRAPARSSKGQSSRGGYMLASDLRDVMRAFDERGDLKRVDNVDWNLELGAITELIALRDGPALLFDHIRGYPAGYRVMTNFMNSPRRAA